MKKAFTLIELLVVIAIIAILAAILFPVFAQAKQAAKRTADLSNIKNITLGQILYTGDSDDVATPFLLGDWGDAGYVRWNMFQWKDLLLPYIKNGGRYMKPNRDPYLLSEGKVGGIFESPLDEHAWQHNNDQPVGAGGDSSTRFPRSYGLNASAGRNEFGVYGQNGENFSKKTSFWPYVEWKDQGNTGGPGNMTSLESSANTIMIEGTRLPYPTLEAHEIVYRCDAGWCGYDSTNQNWMRSVGNGLINVGFFDGHAKAVKGKQAIANDMFGLYSKYITQDGWPGRKQVLDYMKDLTEWQ